MRLITGWTVAMALLAASLNGCASSGGVPSAVVREAPPLELPGASRPEKDEHGLFDCNNPVHWSGDTVYAFSSVGHPWRGTGPDLFHMRRPGTRVTFHDPPEWVPGPRWIESTHKDPGGRLYGWYHNEPRNICGAGTHLTAPRIGALVSDDDGLNWRDLGLVLEAPPDSLQCETANHYFAGGNGDFSVIADRDGKYLYFLISTYHRDVAEQGISIARMRYADRDDPVGKVQKWHAGGWGEPGIGGHVTPIFPVTIDWNKPDADAPWGASIHWNTHVKRFVILFNRTRNSTWAQEGIYVTFNPDLADPGGWAAPLRILGLADFDPAYEHWWYPQVVGIDAAHRETDKLAGRVARFFIRGKSKWEIVFLRPGEQCGRPAWAPAATRADG